ncbi:MAG TPA: phosphatidylglycerophosphatase A, partial [Labilithrix sp.]
MKRFVAYAIATWFGVGYTPLAPGTAGTLAALPVWWALRGRPIPLAATSIALASIGIWAADEVVRCSKLKDPQIVVVDEVAGVLLALAAAPATWRGAAAAVVLFRICDQLKPFPARRAERKLPGGWGVVLDD